MKTIIRGLYLSKINTKRWNSRRRFVNAVLYVRSQHSRTQHFECIWWHHLGYRWTLLAVVSAFVSAANSTKNSQNGLLNPTCWAYQFWMLLATMLTAFERALKPGIEERENGSCGQVFFSKRKVHSGWKLNNGNSPRTTSTILTSSNPNSMVMLPELYLGNRSTL